METSAHEEQPDLGQPHLAWFPSQASRAHYPGYHGEASWTGRSWLGPMSGGLVPYLGADGAWRNAVCGCRTDCSRTEWCELRRRPRV
ncbi:hypothetical protein [Nonomuraea indica]|uniref:Uncharacterized protein n=1 Tax=Nonomuraea indica TaxID=1581193 RepID=A0ABW8ADR8_9ACTN